MPDVGTYFLVLKRPFFFLLFCFCIQWYNSLATCHQQQKGKRGKEQILLHTQQLGVILFRILMFLGTSEATDEC